MIGLSYVSFDLVELFCDDLFIVFKKKMQKEIEQIEKQTYRRPIVEESIKQRDETKLATSRELMHAFSKLTAFTNHII